MRYIKPTGILYKDMGEKKWVEVFFDNNENLVWIPKLIDLADILSKIGVCEDEKYQWPKRNIKGAEMVIEFIKEAIVLQLDTREKLDELCDKYQIPK